MGETVVVGWTLEDDPRTKEIVGGGVILRFQAAEAVELVVAAADEGVEERVEGVMAVGAVGVVTVGALGVVVVAGREVEEEVGTGQVDLMEEAAVAAGAEDVGGGGGDDADGAVALVAPVEAAGPSG